MNEILISILIFSTAAILGSTSNSKRVAKAVNLLSAMGSLVLIYIGIKGIFGGSSWSIGSYIFRGILSGLTYIVLRADQLSGFFLVVLGILSFCSSVYGLSYLDIYKERHRLYSFSYPLFILTMALVLLSWNLLWFIIFWELMSLFSQFLVVFDRNERARKAAFQYFCMTKGGADLLLLSIVISLLAVSGFNASYSYLSLILPFYLSHHPFMFWLIAVYMLIGFGVKSAMVPLHSWLPEAHPEAPSNVSALLSGIMIKLPIYMLFRVYLMFFPKNFYLGIVIGGFAAVTMFFGNMFAIVQRDCKRLPAYSSVGQIGYIMLGLGAGIALLASGHKVLGSLALMASLYHVFSHAVSKGLIFLNAGAVIYSTGTRDLDKLGALAKNMPYTALFGLIGVMSISGIPPLAGFVSKWMIYVSTIPSIWIFSFFGIIAMLMSIATTISFLKYYTAIYSRPGEIEGSINEAPLSMLISQGILASFAIILGIYPCFPLMLIRPIINALGIRVPIASYYILPGIVIPKIANFMPFLVIPLTFGMSIVIAFLISARKTKVWTCGTPVEVNGLKADGYYAGIVESFSWIYSMARFLLRALFSFIRSIAKVSLRYERGSYNLSFMISGAMVFLGILIWILGR